MLSHQSGHAQNGRGLADIDFLATLDTPRGGPMPYMVSGLTSEAFSARGDAKIEFHFDFFEERSRGKLVTIRLSEVVRVRKSENIIFATMFRQSRKIVATIDKVCASGAIGESQRRPCLICL